MHVTSGDDRLFYEDVGKGDPIVLIPGLGTTHQYFNPLTELLKQRYRVIAPDLRGIGQSASQAQQYSMEGWAQDIGQVMAHAGIERAHILGSSLGGCVAQVFAHRYPSRTRSLILAATFSEISPMLELNFRVRKDLILTTGMSELFARYAIAALVGRTTYATPQGQAAAAVITGTIRGNNQDIYLKHLDAVLAFGQCEPGQDRSDTFTRKLRDVRAPALVLVGDEDVLTVPPLSRTIADALPNAKLVVQPACGHLNLMERPQESAREIFDFLAAL